MPPRHIMLFQYGSNMNPDRLNGVDRLNGAAEFVGMAKLPGSGIRFDLYSQNNGCGVTDIVPSAGETAAGLEFRWVGTRVLEAG